MLSSCQKDRQTDCSSFVWLHGNINLQASELHVTPTTVIRGPGSGSFDPNTRLTAHAAKEEINPFPRREEIELFFFFPQDLFCIFGFPSTLALTSLVAQTIKNPPAMQEIWVWSLGGKIPWKRKWQPTPVFLPGEFHGQWSLAGYSPRDHTESDWTEWLTHTTFWKCYFAH